MDSIRIYNIFWGKVQVQLGPVGAISGNEGKEVSSYPATEFL